MEICENGLHYKIDQKYRTASVIKSSGTDRSVFIPRFVKYDETNYKVTSIESGAFFRNEIDSITFPHDSEVIIFKSEAFHQSSVKKLQIPASLTTIEDYAFFQIEGLTDIEVSSRNHLFSYLEGKYLLGKTNSSLDEFDLFIYARFDLETVIVPPCIKFFIKSSINYRLKSLIFPENTRVEEIEYGVIGSHITKLSIPKSLKKINNSCFLITDSLVDVEVSPENKFFSYVDNKYLLTKSDGKNFDQIIFCRRDISDVIIPNYIKKICSCSFSQCMNLKTITFESNCQIKEIEDEAFSWSNSPSEITIVESVTKIGHSAFSANKNLKHIQFLGEFITIENSCFHLCDNLLSISFPNAKRIDFDVLSLSESTKIMVRKDAELIGDINTEFKNQLEFIEEKEKTKKPKVSKPKVSKPKVSKPKVSKPKVSKLISIEEDNYNKIISYVRSLESELNCYKEVTPFNFTTFESGKIATKQTKTAQIEENAFIEENQEEQFEVIEQICEGHKSKVFKIIDHATSRTLCKKVLKIDQDNASFKDVQNAMKEFEVLHMINHPCICKSKFINISEKDRSSEITTISIYIEYLDYKVEDILRNGMLSNTMKVKIAVEVALGMSHLHKLGMIHRDLNISHIMLNGVFESKIIDFGLVKVNDLLRDEFNQSLTKKIGLFAFMSPEMANEEDYDNKTDVYSYGVILYVIFCGKEIDHALNDIVKRKNKLISPRASHSINKNCIELIKRCIAHDPKERPSFDEIIEIMKSNQFSLASDVDPEIINRRIEEINRQISSSPQIHTD